jgi:hypothetical protein
VSRCSPLKGILPASFFIEPAICFALPTHNNLDGFAKLVYAPDGTPAPKATYISRYNNGGREETQR